MEPGEAVTSVFSSQAPDAETLSDVAEQEQRRYVEDYGTVERDNHVIATFSTAETFPQRQEESFYLQDAFCLQHLEDVMLSRCPCRMTHADAREMHMLFFRDHAKEL
jgi:hypothetical protein